MSEKQIIDPGWGYEKDFGYSQGVKAGGLVTFAGQMPVDNLELRHKVLHLFLVFGALFLRRQFGALEGRHMFCAD